MRRMSDETEDELRQWRTRAMIDQIIEETGNPHGADDYILCVWQSRERGKGTWAK